MLKTEARMRFFADEPRMSLGASLLRRLLRDTSCGRLNIGLPNGTSVAASGSRPGANAEIFFKSWRALRTLWLRGDIGFAESYRERDWDTPDLKALLTWAMQNEDSLSSLTRGTWLSRTLNAVQHRLRANTRANSRRNIAAHYDLGNDFYAHWLDRGMNYSSGLYPSSSVTLEAAQATKIDRVAALLDLYGGERVLEIGCGWGALAERLTAEHECHVTGLTLSARQLHYAAKRLQRFGCDDRADLRLQDYRDVTGTFDRVVSIEMLEAVGETYWPTYFDAVFQRLRPGGKAVLQVITIHPRSFQAYRQRPDFIQTHIFPGGMLPTSEIVKDQARRAGLVLRAEEQFAASYVRTLIEWRARFNRAWSRIVALGFDEGFRRLWNYYLVYCEAGFESGTLSVRLYTFERPTIAE